MLGLISTVTFPEVWIVIVHLNDGIVFAIGTSNRKCHILRKHNILREESDYGAIKQ